MLWYVQQQQLANMSKWPSFFLLIPVVWPTLRFLYAKPEYLIFLQFDNWVKICSIRTKYECFSMHLIYAIQFELIYAVDGHRLVRYFEIIIKKFKRIKNLKKKPTFVRTLTVQPLQQYNNGCRFRLSMWACVERIWWLDSIVTRPNAMPKNAPVRRQSKRESPSTVR